MKYALSAFLLLLLAAAPTTAEELQALAYNNPGLVVDLGVGLWAWPAPLDYDHDGDNDLIVSCPDKPHNGVYFFENISGKVKMPVFKAGVRLGPAARNLQASYIDGQPRLLTPGFEIVGFLSQEKGQTGWGRSKKIFPKANIHPGKIRANQWKYADLNNDGALDLIVGVGDWAQYGWDDAFNAQGRWTRGPLHGYVYWLKNRGGNDSPDYAPPVKLTCTTGDVDVYGMPSPNLEDFDHDGDLDLLCGEFLDGFTYFENQGGPTEPRFAAGRRLTHNGQPLAMDLEMITPVAFDWDADGDHDLIVGDEDGRVALIENTGKIIDGLPQFLPPRYLQQEAENIKFGALATPYAFDWDGDSDQDLLCGNTAGYIGFIENLGGNPPRWAAPTRLRAGGETLRIVAGENGSIQGPCEAKWGYTTLTVADWNQDSLPDLIVNSIWGKVVWYQNIGDRQHPRLAAAQPVKVQWEGQPPYPAWNWWRPDSNELATQWRTTPVAIDFTGDGLTDLVMLDHQGYLALFERTKQNGELVLLPGKRVFVDEKMQPLRLNAKRAGGSGRRKLVLADWDRDGRLDILLNSQNADWLRNVGQRQGRYLFENKGLLDTRKLAGHTSSPATARWGGGKLPDLLVGGEDGYVYFRRNPGNEKKPASAVVQAELIYEQAPFPECHASTIADTPAGLVAAWFGGTEEKHPDVGIWVSRYRDGRWTAPVEAFNGVKNAQTRYPCWNPVLHQPKNGPLLLFYKVGPSPSTWWGMLARSSDNGKTWSDAVRLPDGILGPIKNKPVALSNGVLLCPTSSEHAGWRVHFEMTPDLGKSWTRTKAVNDGKKFGAIQPSVLFHSGGRLQALCRSRQGKLTQIWSNDNGKTWGEMTATSLPNPNAGADGVTLADGRQLLVYNHTVRGGKHPRGREMLNVAVSPDGEQWFAALILENERGEFSYPAVIQAADGLVHITYTWQRRRIKHVVLDPRRLTLKKIENGKWPF